MLRTRAKTCAGRCRFGHPARKQSPRRRGVGMFRRDKTPLSGALHRFAKGVLKHRPRSGVTAIMSRGIALVSRLTARGRVLVNMGTGHRTRSRAWPCWRWITPPGAGRSHRINTTRPAHTVWPGSRASLHRPAKVGHGETLFAAISGNGRGGSEWAKAGATRQNTASNRHTAPGKGATQSTGKATRSTKAWDRMGEKGAVCM
jgi:hypothetical protein